METIRNGQIVWPYCGECGCRLSIAGSYDSAWIGKVLLTHFIGFKYDCDARGHKCSKLYDYNEIKRSLLYRGLAQLG